MAIKIPSRNIYEKDNDKIRDNKIDRIEVGAVSIKTKEVKSENFYRESGSISDFDNMSYIEEYTAPDTSEYPDNVLDDFGNFNDLYGTKASFYLNLGAVIIKTKYLRFNAGAFKTKETTIERTITSADTPEFSYTVTKQTGKISEVTIKYGSKNAGVNSIYNRVGSYFNNAVFKDIIPNYTSNEKFGGKLTDKLNYEYTSKGYYSAYDKIIKAKARNDQNFDDAIVDVKSDGYNRYFQLKDSVYLLVGVEIFTITKTKHSPSTDQINAFDIEYAPEEETLTSGFTGYCEKYEAENITITIGGNQIQVSTEDDNIIVGRAIANKPFSVEGNELVQKANYYKENGTSSIEEMFRKTLDNYAKGKETATIRCSISDYFNDTSAKVLEYTPMEENRVWCRLDVGSNKEAEILNGLYIKVNGVNGFVVDYDENIIFVNFYSLSIVEELQKGYISIQGIKSISADGSTGKMAFDIYDEVIPYSYGADGSDKPLSRHKDGSPKTFVVLGTRIFYDGAVWQELTLQEK
jgi:hypothetical protein